MITAGNTGADYRAAPLGTVLAGLNTTSFEALPLEIARHAWQRF
jgi:hypothetical protein